MAVVLGTNCGFVTTAPVDDPAGSGIVFDGWADVNKFTSPSTAYRVTEMGWWCDTASEEANFEVGLYEANGTTVPGEAGGLVHVSRTNAKGTTAGWKRVTGLDWVITPNTNYWLGVQLDATATATSIDNASSGFFGYDTKTATSLPSPFLGGSLWDSNGADAIYAVYDTGPASSPVALSGAWALSGSTGAALNSGSFSVTVPSGATLGLIGVTGYYNQAYYFTSGAVTLGGSPMSVAFRADGDTSKFMGGLFYIIDPSSGSQTVAYDWYGSANPSNAPLFTGCFYSGSHATSPIRASGGQQVASGTATTGSMTAQSNDLAVAYGFGYANTPTADSMAFTSGAEVWESYWTAQKDVAGWAHGYPTGNYTITRTDVGPMDDGGICGVIIQPAAGGGATPTFTSVNIGDVWKTISGSGVIKVNVGDSWKDCQSMKVNVGDSWKACVIS